MAKVKSDLRSDTRAQLGKLCAVQINVHILQCYLYFHMYKVSKVLSYKLYIQSYIILIYIIGHPVLTFK